MYRNLDNNNIKCSKIMYFYIIFKNSCFYFLLYFFIFKLYSNRKLLNMSDSKITDKMTKIVSDTVLRVGISSYKSGKIDMSGAVPQIAISGLQQYVVNPVIDGSGIKVSNIINQVDKKKTVDDDVKDFIDDFATKTVTEMGFDWVMGKQKSINNVIINNAMLAFGSFLVDKVWEG